MTQGRNPKPAALRRLEGDTGHRPERPGQEPKPDSQIPKMPNGFSAMEKRAWKKLAPALNRCGLLTQIDGDLLESYVRMYAHAAACWQKAKEQGPVVQVAGRPQANPYITEAIKAEDRLHKLRGEIGLSPVSRAKLRVDAPAAAADSLGDFLKLHTA